MERDRHPNIVLIGMPDAGSPLYAYDDSVITQNNGDHDESLRNADIRPGR